MGKIYEAITRAETDRQSKYPFPDLDGPERNNDRDNGKEERDSEHFNFMRYSMRASSIVDRERKKREAASEAMSRRSVAQPAHEVFVDLGRMDPHLAAFYNIDPRASEQYNKLALTLISRAAERGIKRVLIASAQPGEGRTTVTLNLACALARARQRVMVIDCDLLKPAVMRMLGLHCDIGIEEAFSGAMLPGAAALSVQPFGFNVLPTRRPVENHVELLAAPGFWKMLQAFDPDYDFILFDSSPLLTAGDSSLLVRFTDTTLLVVSQGKTSSAQLGNAISGFSQNDVLGVVINRTRE